MFPETSGNNAPHRAFGAAFIVRNIACLGLYNIIPMDALWSEDVPGTNQKPRMTHDQRMIKKLLGRR